MVHAYMYKSTLDCSSMLWSPSLVQAEAEALADLLKEFPSQCATLCFTCKVRGSVKYNTGVRTDLCVFSLMIVCV